MEQAAPISLCNNPETLQIKLIVMISNTLLCDQNELPSEKVVITYKKLGNIENYIREAMYDMAI